MKAKLGLRAMVALKPNTIEWDREVKGFGGNFCQIPFAHENSKGAEHWLESAYALRQRLSRRHQVHAALRLSEPSSAA